jgi:hypothetical protein
MMPAYGLSVLVAMGLWGLPAQPPVSAASTVIQLRVFAHAAMDAPALELARATASRLLESAGVGIEWRTCGSVEEACSEPGHAPQVIVLLMPMTKLTRDDVGAEALHGGSIPVPTVLVYLPNLADRLRTVHQSAAARSNSGLASLQMGHLVGLAIAHEIGHCFGLSHSPSGVMKALITSDDLIALATLRLAFTSKETSALTLFVSEYARSR